METRTQLKSVIFTMDIFAVQCQVRFEKIVQYVANNTWNLVKRTLKSEVETQIQSFRMTYYCTVINKKTYQQCNAGISQIIFKKIWTLLYRCCHCGYIFQICNALKLRHQLRSQVLHVKKSVKTKWGTKISWKTVVLFCLKAFFQIIFTFFPPFF